MKTLATFFMLLLIGQILCAQEKKPWSVDRLCGRVDHVEEIPDRKNANTYTETRKALRDVALALYERRDSEACCNSSSLADKITTNRSGDFDFRNKKAGLYWLTTNWHGKQYQIAVEYKPEKDSVTKCSQQGISVDSAGNANWWVTVTVD